MASNNKKIIRKEPLAMVLNNAIGRRLLNVREAAQYLGLEVDTIYRKARLRQVPCVKDGPSFANLKIFHTLSILFHTLSILTSP